MNSAPLTYTEISALLFPGVQIEGEFATSFPALDATSLILRALCSLPARGVSRSIPGTSVFLAGDIPVPRPTPGSLQSGENALAASRTHFPCTSYYLCPL